MYKIDFDFEPDSKRAELLNKNMHSALQKSLVHIREELKNNNSNYHFKLDNIIALLENNKNLPPVAFGWYYNAVFAFLKHDDKAAQESLDKLSNISYLNNQEIKIYSFGEEHIYNDKKMYMQRLGEYVGFDFTPPDNKTAHTFKSNLNKALFFIKDKLPKLYEEISYLLSDVYIVQCPDYKYEINGAAVFQLWRLVFLKVNLSHSIIKLVEAFAHETAHVFLFANTINEPLTHNRKDELYYSPFRKVERPIDGIYHGVFVAARVCWAMNNIINHNTISEDNINEAKQILAENHYNFINGYKTLMAHAKLSETGDKLLQSAYEYIKSNIPNDYSAECA